MTNPAPRPALQKAPDADVHPAHPALLETRARTGWWSAGDATERPGEIDLRARVSASPKPPSVVPSPDGANPGVDDTEGSDAVAKKSKKSNKGSSKAKGSSKKKSSKKNDKKKKKSSKGKKKKGKGQQPSARTAKRIDLRVTVPQSVRRSLRTGVKARGTSVGDAVDSVLANWQKT